MLGRTRKRLGDMLVEANVITGDQLMEALAKQKESGKRLGEILVDLRFTDETEIVEARKSVLPPPQAALVLVSLSQQ